MIEFCDWSQQLNRQPNGWLLIGEGPTFAEMNNVDLSQRTTVGLNHVFRHTPVDFAIVLDAETIDCCSASDLKDVGTLLMPTEPYVHGRPGTITLDELVRVVPALQTLADDGRVVGFDRSGLEACSSGFDKHRPALDERIACELLAKLGATTLETLGCDETADLHDDFRPFHESHSLVTDPQRQRKQRDHRRKHLANLSLTCTPLTQPFRVFINADESQELAASVLARQIRDHATTTVAVTVLKNPPLPRVRNPQCWPRDPRALTRFFVPEMTGYQGQALFVQADMLVRNDVSELAQLAMEDCQVAVLRRSDSAGWESSLQVINCERADWKIEAIIRELDEGRYTSDELIHNLALIQDSKDIAESIPSAWRPTSGKLSKDTRVHRFLDPKHQPWKQELGNCPTWDAALQRAIATGDVSVDDVYDASEDGYINESLLDAFSEEQMELFRARRRFPLPQRPQGNRLVVLTQRAYAFAGRSARNPAGAVRRLLHGSW